MVSVADLPPSFVELLQKEFPFVFEDAYMRSRSEHRWLDIYEVYSGCASIARAAERVSHLQVLHCMTRS